MTDKLSTEVPVAQQSARFQVWEQQIADLTTKLLHSERERETLFQEKLRLEAANADLNRSVEIMIQTMEDAGLEDPRIQVPQEHSTHEPLEKRKKSKSMLQRMFTISSSSKSKASANAAKKISESEQRRGRALSLDDKRARELARKVSSSAQVQEAKVENAAATVEDTARKEFPGWPGWPLLLPKDEKKNDEQVAPIAETETAKGEELGSSSGVCESLPLDDDDVGISVVTVEEPIKEGRIPSKLRSVSSMLTTLQEVNGYSGSDSKTTCSDGSSGSKVEKEEPQGKQSARERVASMRARIRSMTTVLTDAQAASADRGVKAERARRSGKRGDADSETSVGTSDTDDHSDSQSLNGTSETSKKGASSTDSQALRIDPASLRLDFSSLQPEEKKSRPVDVPAKSVRSVVADSCEDLSYRSGTSYLSSFTDLSELSAGDMSPQNHRKCLEKPSDKVAPMGCVAIMTSKKKSRQKSYSVEAPVTETSDMSPASARLRELRELSDLRAAQASRASEQWETARSDTDTALANIQAVCKQALSTSSTSPRAKRSVTPTHPTQPSPMSKEGNIAAQGYTGKEMEKLLSQVPSNGPIGAFADLENALVAGTWKRKSTCGRKMPRLYILDTLGIFGLRESPRFRTRYRHRYRYGYRYRLTPYDCRLLPKT